MEYDIGKLTAVWCIVLHLLDADKAARARAVNPAGALQGQKGADEQDKYVINIKQIAKSVVAVGDRVALTDVEEGVRVEYAIISCIWIGY